MGITIAENANTSFEHCFKSVCCARSIAEKEEGLLALHQSRAHRAESGDSQSHATLSRNRAWVAGKTGGPPANTPHSPEHCLPAYPPSPNLFAIHLPVLSQKTWRFRETFSKAQQTPTRNPLFPNPHVGIFLGGRKRIEIGSKFWGGSKSDRNQIGIGGGTEIRSQKAAQKNVLRTAAAIQVQNYNVFGRWKAWDL